MLLVIATVAVLLDLLLGEPRHAHPLVLFGNWVQRIEARLYRDRRSAGILAWCVSVLPLTVVAAALQWGLWRFSPWTAAGFAAITLYLALGLRSLGEHAHPVIAALQVADLPAARAAVGRIVSRDTAVLDATQVAAAATESVLENGSDAVFAALFWGVLLGAPGAVLYRLSNTLDAIWGYRTPRYANFGWAAARIDDALNWLPARLTAVTYAVLGRTRAAIRCARRQGRGWKSPNAGPVMAAGAGALHVQLGGPAPYHGHWQARPPLGEGASATANSVQRALRLVRAGVALWLLLGTLATALAMR
ncbi:adenosylcobinamide-phosphate synthase CbiB [Xanthomonas prunicola]|uniref:Cobalamin biosynthesis protein CobD n=1 Tax=Xanthomonas prunicola TaxID=2053930 RepID=A0A9Q9J790_9XANT|nr:adenosylcobinamide-phosphate synthase CbiB [Xanthomonas prunicola]UXA51211.1 adenosylcobinamide-phosphate synthase CbiB [Xanthomonas prunicola]UXA59448.1 adenosylcobinamide-phosphate synthase CbiB [Xanthomonas prunicola]UXA63394.1 adenosylcobinamide-phosphate synthase CbiB [Xanthomonas prunicola]UXA67645.1 adenosylcobinamide-phosphate synthase CbiB [Xanthomonas prunicola]